MANSQACLRCRGNCAHIPLMKYVLLIALLVARLALADDAAPASAFASGNGSAAFDAAFEASIQRAGDKYPDAVVYGSALRIAIQKEINALTASKSPVLRDPSWPEFVAIKCAAELGIAPKLK